MNGTHDLVKLLEQAGVVRVKDRLRGEPLRELILNMAKTRLGTLQDHTLQNEACISEMLETTPPPGKEKAFARKVASLRERQTQYVGYIERIQYLIEQTPKINFEKLPQNYALGVLWLVHVINDACLDSLGTSHSGLDPRKAADRKKSKVLREAIVFEQQLIKSARDHWAPLDTKADVTEDFYVLLDLSVSISLRSYGKDPKDV